MPASSQKLANGPTPTQFLIEESLLLDLISYYLFTEFARGAELNIVQGNCENNLVSIREKWDVIPPDSCIPRLYDINCYHMFQIVCTFYELFPFPCSGLSKFLIEIYDREEIEIAITCCI